MNVSCPNKNLPEWKNMVETAGLDEALRMYLFYDYQVPTMEQIARNPYYNKSEKQVKDMILAQAGTSNFVSPAAYVSVLKAINQYAKYAGRQIFKLEKTNGTSYVLRQVGTKDIPKIDFSIAQANVTTETAQQQYDFVSSMVSDEDKKQIYDNTVAYFRNFAKLNENQIAKLKTLGIATVSDLSSLTSNDYLILGKLQQIICS